MAWDPKGDGKTVVRASYGMFFDHPLLGLYFLGDASMVPPADSWLSEARGFAAEPASVQPESIPIFQDCRSHSQPGESVRGDPQPRYPQPRLDTCPANSSLSR